MQNTFYITMALIPKSSGEPESDDYGSFMFNGTPYVVNETAMNTALNTSSENLGENVGDLRYGSNLPSVDSDTFYFEYSFTFANVFEDENDGIPSGFVEQYTTIENTNELGGPVDFVDLNLELDSVKNLMLYAAFEFDMSTLKEFDVRLDLYTIDKNGNIASASETHYVQTAPEPGTMLLFGFGLIWMARIGRKKLL